MLYSEGTLTDVGDEGQPTHPSTQLKLSAGRRRRPAQEILSVCGSLCIYQVRTAHHCWLDCPRYDQDMKCL